MNAPSFSTGLHYKALQLAALIGLSTAGCTADPNDLKFGSEIKARIAAEDAVSRNLKYPHDATFDWAYAELSPAKNGFRDWVVIGKVKARNAFGADLTSEYRARVRWSAASKTWQTVLVMLNNEVIQFDAVAAAELEARSRPSPLSKAATTNPTPPSNALPQVRTWRTKDGKTYNGKLIAATKTNAEIETQEGQQIRLELTNLTNFDRLFVANAEAKK